MIVVMPILEKNPDDNIDNEDKSDNDDVEYDNIVSIFCKQRQYHSVIMI